MHLRDNIRHLLERRGARFFSCFRLGALSLLPVQVVFVLFLEAAIFRPFSVLATRLVPKSLLVRRQRPFPLFFLAQLRGVFFVSLALDFLLDQHHVADLVVVLLNALVFALTLELVRLTLTKLLLLLGFHQGFLAFAARFLLRVADRLRHIVLSTAPCRSVGAFLLLVFVKLRVQCVALSSLAVCAELALLPALLCALHTVFLGLLDPLSICQQLTLALCGVQQ
mmetsp:Transcript_39251/g.121331  ORF Transcript_39251/g.121331 Transcript_39251/m.121331 type:complete len:224 (-) Transcript_39251:470-1141(-)